MAAILNFIFSCHLSNKADLSLGGKYALYSPQTSFWYTTWMYLMVNLEISNFLIFEWRPFWIFLRSSVSATGILRDSRDSVSETLWKGTVVKEILLQFFWSEKLVWLDYKWVLLICHRHINNHFWIEYFNLKRYLSSRSNLFTLTKWILIYFYPQYFFTSLI